jgi:peptidoglycan/xylan/chitin deacetylase (PgdA/CDA1 family)
MAIVFTGDEFADGGDLILDVLSKHNLKASFFLTGNFYADKRFHSLIEKAKANGHYLGAHSDKHLLYCDWNQRDSLLVTKQQFVADLQNNYKKMKTFGIAATDAAYFLPPYEWYNDTIAAWTREGGLRLVNFTPGTRTNADYTTPEMRNYRNSEVIFNSITDYEEKSKSGLNGFIMLLHIGTDPARTDKFYNRLERLIEFLAIKKYKPVRIDELLSED